jgi:ubiquinone/menaquinone biosynthesis C-methylase UbiE
MKNLENWDKKNWLSSDAYISSLNHFLKKQINFNKETKILDIGCGRGKIISTLSKKHQMNNLPLGIDIVKHKDNAKRIRFIKINAL